MSGEVRICGLGMRVPEETTLESLIALEECRVVYVAVKDPKGLAWLRKRMKVKPARSAKEVVEDASSGGRVGLAVWGHPQFCSPLARDVEAALRERKLPFRVYGAVSPAGSAFARSVSFLGGDYGYQGAQCLELETLLADPSKLSQEMPLIVFAEHAAPARWQALAKLLAPLYPKKLELRAYPAGTDEEKILPLEKLGPKTLTGGILLVPPPNGAPKRPHDLAKV